jgi:hypothetical protein
MFNPNQAFLFGGLNSFTLGVKAAIEKIFSISPKLLINAELHSLVYVTAGATKKN